MINILTTAVGRRTGGATKVFRNLARGLDLIAERYVVNTEPREGQRIWVHDYLYALPAVLRLREAQRVLGPNLFVMPADIPGLRFTGCVYLQPSAWATEVWRRSGFDDCPVRTWPVGVDTREFGPTRQRGDRHDVILYHKFRRSDELAIIRDALDNAGIQPVDIVYGHYSETEYKQALARAAFVVWHGRHESQGLALLEALAADVPVLVCDVTSLLDAVGDAYQFLPETADFRVTAAPYFDERCGLRITDLRELPSALETIRVDLDRFRPREFVLETLSLEKQAEAFLRIWDDEWGAPRTPFLLGRTGWTPGALDVAVFRARRRLHVTMRRQAH